MLTLILALLALPADADKLGDPAFSATLTDKIGEPFPRAPLPSSLRLPPASAAGPVYQVTLPLYPDAPTRADLEPIGAKLDAVQLALRAMADARRPAPATHGHPIAGPEASTCFEGCECRYPGDCKEDGCRCRSAAKPAAKAAPTPVMKRWYNLTNEAGTQGYGALNSAGQVVVEQRRPRPAAAPLPVAAPVQPYYVQVPSYFYAGGGCPNGRCGR